MMIGYMVNAMEKKDYFLWSLLKWYKSYQKIQVFKLFVWCNTQNNLNSKPGTCPQPAYVGTHLFYWNCFTKVCVYLSTYLLGLQHILGYSLEFWYPDTRFAIRIFFYYCFTRGNYFDYQLCFWQQNLLCYLDLIIDSHHHFSINFRYRLSIMW